MTWNWYTVDACFISQQLHIRSKGKHILVLSMWSFSDMLSLSGAFAATVIMIFIITALVEGVRRAGREYDRRLLAQARAQAPLDSPALDAKSKGSDYTDSAPRCVLHDISFCF
jgi:copper transporter 1